MVNELRAIPKILDKIRRRAASLGAHAERRRSDLDGAQDDEAAVTDNESWLAAFHDATRPFTSDRCFPNYADGAETNYLRASYGENLEREIKRRYDPADLFRFKQSIPLSL